MPSRPTPKIDPQAWPDIPATAALWGTTPRYIKRLVYAGKIESVLLDRVRVNPESMAAFFESRRRPAVSR